ncbi:MAG: DUF2861 family protein, partial [Myxococcales bacterium]|nr:DUF2861 family protein [Myxococcales bacterium]
ESSDAGVDGPAENATAVPDSAWPAGDAPIDLAHQAYLDGDVPRCLDHLKDALTSPEEAVRANAMELLDALWEAEGGALPSRWNLPDGLDWLGITLVVRREPDGVFYRIVLRGGLAQADLLDSLSLVNAVEDIAVLDSEAGLGSWRVAESDESAFEFELEGADQLTPPEPGLYWLSARLRDGESLDGWVVLSWPEQLSYPTIRRPIHDEIIRSPHPEIEWEATQAAPATGFESRFLSVWIASLGEEEDRLSPTWSLWTDDIPSSPLGVGQSVEGAWSSDAELPEGSYWLSFGLGHGRRFGQVRLHVVARSALRFHVGDIE